MTQEPDSLDSERAPWQQRYEQGATGWDRGAPSPALLQWFDDGLFEDVKTVAVPGCGRGHEVVELARRGFDVTAIDFAPAAIEALSTKLAEGGTSATLIHGSVLEFHPHTQFDAAYEQTCMCALPPEQWGDYELQLAKWLKPGGTLFALFMQTNKPNGPPFHCDMKTMREIFNATRWEWPTERKRIEHPSGLHEFAAPIKRNNQEGSKRR